MAEVMPEAEYDGPWKEAVEQYLADCLALLFPTIHAQIDWSRSPDFLDTELQQIVPRAEGGPRTVDKLVRVWRTSGEETWVLLHVEIQSQQTSDFAARTLEYHIRLRGHFLRPIVSVAILGDDRRGWRPREQRNELWGCVLVFRFPMVKLIDFRTRWPELEGSGNPFAAVVMAHLRALQTRHDATRRARAKRELVAWLLSRGYAADEVRRLFRFIDWLLLLPPEADRAFLAEVRALEEEHQMPYITSVERIAREDGIEQGIERGIEQGIERGIEQGERRLAHVALEGRFGPLSADLLAALQTANEATLLDVVAHLSTDTLEQIRARLGAH